MSVSVVCDVVWCMCVCGAPADVFIGEVKRQVFREHAELFSSDRLLALRRMVVGIEKECALRRNVLQAAIDTLESAVRAVCVALRVRRSTWGFGEFRGVRVCVVRRFGWTPRTQRCATH